MKKILIVDDTKTLLSLVQVYLMGWGLEFVTAGDGLEGLEKAKAERPDLVITDVQMPRMDGFELCAALHADLSLGKVPVVLLTALADAESREKGRLVGAAAFLTKPIAVASLREVVGGFLGLPGAKK